VRGGSATMNESVVAGWGRAVMKQEASGCAESSKATVSGLGLWLRRNSSRDFAATCAHRALSWWRRCFVVVVAIWCVTDPHRLVNPVHWSRGPVNRGSLDQCACPVL
jgi:hypothetical protein